ncbi:hypothetical protein F3Y22_tig00116959pilonHSYRG00373 [Hibiscus syriacus]|uniref:Reverse transcriptase Ty1/copia-type domain-containing protein n=1 Tax=Hibiscus syriacus TaxID=106335 RepID=A0A6A2XUT6_HIBSY|nr:hypothetical protein F3Y22_tig00116959pilonHSYRG00373 [Hibiscus syriacus]
MAANDTIVGTINFISAGILLANETDNACVTEPYETELDPVLTDMCSELNQRYRIAQDFFNSRVTRVLGVDHFHCLLCQFGDLRSHRELVGRPISDLVFLSRLNKTGCCFEQEKSCHLVICGATESWSVVQSVTWSSFPRLNKTGCCFEQEKTAVTINPPLTLKMMESNEHAITTGNEAGVKLTSPKFTKTVHGIMHAKYDALQSNNTWFLVKLPESRTTVGCKWFKFKRNPDDSVHRYKARLMAKSYSQVPGSDFKDTFKLVGKLATLNVVLSSAVTKKWELRHVNVNNPFLNG